MQIPRLTWTQAYSYDPAKRLTGVAESGSGASWNETYRYTSAGGVVTRNRWLDLGSSARTGLPALTLETATGPDWYLGNNRVNGWGYDGIGNVQNIGYPARSFTYHTEAQQLTASASGNTASYVYDAEGKRVMKTVNGVTTVYVYDATSKLVAEYVAQNQPSPCGTATCFVTVDHLGSTRMLTDSAGNVAKRCDYMPFGSGTVHQS